MECFIDASDPVRSTQIRSGRIGRDSQAKRRSYKYYQMFMIAQNARGMNLRVPNSIFLRSRGSNEVLSLLASRRSYAGRAML
jgi:hypothetical protein